MRLFQNSDRCLSAFTHSVQVTQQRIKGKYLAKSRSARSDVSQQYRDVPRPRRCSILRPVTTSLCDTCERRRWTTSHATSPSGWHKVLAKAHQCCPELFGPRGPTTWHATSIYHRTIHHQKEKVKQKSNMNKKNYIRACSQGGLIDGRGINTFRFASLFSVLFISV